MIYNKKLKQSKNNLLKKYKSTRRRIPALKKLIIKQLKFSVKSNFVIILITIFFLISWFFPKQFPNFLNIKSITVVITVLSTMTGALAAIFGILIAILLVAFEILRKTYASYAFREFFQSSTLKHLFTLFISTVIISIISITNIENSLTIRNLNLFYLAIFLFIICLIVLYPSFKAILTSTNSERKIKEIVNRINIRNANIPSIVALREITFDYISAIDEHPILILIEAAIQTIKDNDMLMSKFIIFESTKKLLEFLEWNKDDTTAIAINTKRDIINSFLLIFRHSAEQAIKQRDTTTLLNILVSIERIHIFCARNKVSWNEVIELDDTLQGILEQVIKADLYEVAREGIWVIENILEAHLKENIPSEKDVWLLHPWEEVKNTKIDYNKEGQWDYISAHYIYMLYELLKKSIELRRAELVFQGLSAFESISSEVVRSNLGNLQKRFIVKFCYYYIESLILECADGGLYNGIAPLFALNPFSISDALDKKAEFSKIPLIYLGETLIQLAEKNVLDSWTLNNLGTVGRGNVEKIDDNLHEEALLFICRVFDKIREALERNDKVTNDKVTENRRAYIETFNQVESIKKWMESKNKHNDIIEKEISSILKKFVKLEDYKKEDEDKNIKWPNLDDEKNRDDAQDKK